MKKTVINRNKEKADLFISSGNRGLRKAQALVDLYHANMKLQRIRTPKQLGAYLTSPFEYYRGKAETHIREVFPDEALNFDKVQGMFSYSLEGYKKHHTSEVTNLIPYLKIHIGELTLVPDWKDKVRDSFIEYTEDSDEVEFIKRVRGLSKEIKEIWETVKPIESAKPNNILMQLGLDKEGFDITPRCMEIIRKRIKQ